MNNPYYFAKEKYISSYTKAPFNTYETATNLKPVPILSVALFDNDVQANFTLQYISESFAFNKLVSH